MKELITAFLAKTLNMAPESVAELLYKKSDDGATLTEEIQEDALNALLKLDSERVGKLKPDTKTLFDNGYKKAQAEVSEKWEKMIREKFGIEADVTGEDLVMAAHQMASKPPKQADDQVKAHPLYLQLEKKYQADLEAAKSEGQKALEEFKTGVERRNRLSAVQQEARKYLLSRKPVLSSDATKQENQIGLFLQQFEGYDFEPREDGGFLPMKDGKRIENEHGHPVDLKTLADKVADSYFDFQVQDAKGNGGNGNPPGGAGTGSGKAPASEEELWRAYNAAQTQEEKNAVMTAYEKAHGEIQV